jgi:outer membrane protein OmpA-like peptidoglycan-associated protein
LPRAEPVPDLSTTSVPDPLVLPIRSLTDALDRSRSIAEDDREVDIRLSNDVLFAIDSARLSGRARGVLQDAARRIERAGAESVRLEGHADTTGNDAINDPLSRRRAQAVARALRAETGAGVRFTARGYGSRRPIASNDDAEGRRRNRRVSVIFTRPPEPVEAEPEEPERAPVQGEPAAGKTIEVKGTGVTAGASVTVELESFVAEGDLATLTYKVVNTGAEETELSQLLASGREDPYRFDRQSITGITLLDRAARQRSFIAAVRVEGEEVCVCSDTAGPFLGLGILEPGEEGRYYATYAVPETTEAVTIELGPDTELPDVAIDRG